MYTRKNPQSNSQCFPIARESIRIIITIIATLINVLYNWRSSIFVSQYISVLSSKDDAYSTTERTKYKKKNLVVEFAVDYLVAGVDELERVRAVAVHVTITVGNTSIGEQDHDLMRCLGS